MTMQFAGYVFVCVDVPYGAKNVCKNLNKKSKWSMAGEVFFCCVGYLAISKCSPVLVLLRLLTNCGCKG